MIDRRPQASRILVAQLTGEAKHHARWRDLTADEEAAAVAALRELGRGRADLLAEVAGVLEGASEGELDEPLARQAVGLCRAAGADPEAIPAWIEEGRRRRAAADMPPFSGGLHGGGRGLPQKSRASHGIASVAFPQDGRPSTAENALLAAVARPRQDTRQSRACVRFVPLVHLQHNPRVSCSGSVAVCAALGEEAVSYQQPPEQRACAPAGAPPGWYPDPGGLQALRWWDGALWSAYTQPLSGAAQEPQLPFPGVAGSASSGYGAFRQERAGGHRQQGGLQDDMAYTPDLASFGPSPASFPPGQPQQPDPYQPQGWPQQQPYAPGPQPRGHRAPRQPGNRKGRRALIGLSTLIGIIVAISVATAHNSPSTGNVAATSTASAAAPASAASAAPDCTSQVISWRDNGGLTQLEAVITDMGNVQSSATALGTDLSAGADTSQDQASLQTAAASLQSDSQTAQANLPPSCVPDLRTDEGAALNDASKGALDCQNAVSELGSGNYSVAPGDVNASTAAITASGNKFQAATSDVNAFSNG